jgi:hypothetical protein
MFKSIKSDIPLPGAVQLRHSIRFPPDIFVLLGEQLGDNAMGESVVICNSVVLSMLPLLVGV